MKKLLLLVLNMAAAMSLFTFSTSASAQIGSLSSDLVFTPVTPCRIMDTRNAGSNSGILLAGTTRTFYGLSSAGNYPSQGSSNANCGALVPGTNDTAAIVLNFTTVAPAAAGYITAYPTGAAQPEAATVNFTAGSVIGNNATLKVNQTGGAAQFNIFTTTNVHLVADIVGYYSKPVSAGSLECIDTVSPGAVPLAASGTATVSSAACTAGYAMTGGSCVGSSFAANVVTSRVNGSTYFCAYQNSGASATTVNAIGRCCRIPGR